MTLCIGNETLSVLIVCISPYRMPILKARARSYNVFKMYAKRFFYFFNVNICAFILCHTIQEQEDEWIRGMAYTTSRIQVVCGSNTVYGTIFSSF